MEGKKELKNSKEIADLFGFDERRVQQLAKENIIPAVRKRPYQFDLNETVKAYIQYLKEKANGREQKDASDEKSTSDKLRAEADLKKYKAKMTELQLKEMEGKMHRSEDVEAAVNDLVYNVRSMIMALPGRLAVNVVNAENANEASEMIRVECSMILNELAEHRYDPEEYKRRVRERKGWSEIPDDEDDE